MSLCISCNPVQDQREECSQWVRDRLVPFVRSQEGCQDVRIAGDISSGNPGGTCLVEMGDSCSITSVLETPEGKELKQEFADYGCRFSI